MINLNIPNTMMIGSCIIVAADAAWIFTGAWLAEVLATENQTSNKAVAKAFFINFYPLRIEFRGPASCPVAGALAPAGTRRTSSPEKHNFSIPDAQLSGRKRQ